MVSHTVVNGDSTKGDRILKEVFIVYVLLLILLTSSFASVNLSLSFLLGVFFNGERRNFSLEL